MTDRFRSVFLSTGVAFLCIACVSCGSAPAAAPFNTAFWGGDDPNVIACFDAILYPRNELGTLFTCRYLQHEVEKREAYKAMGKTASGPQDLGSTLHLAGAFHVGTDTKNSDVRSTRSRLTVKFHMPNTAP